MRKPDLSHYAPPGMNLRQEVIAFLWGYGAAVVFALRFVIRYGIAYSDLFIYEFGTNVRHLKVDARMDTFADLLEGVFNLFPVLGLCLVLWAALHYLYHYQGSRSIYTMRRLPSRWELHRRCLTLPVLGAVVCAATAAVLLSLFYGLYMLMTPDVAMQHEQWEFFWRELFA